MRGPACVMLLAATLLCGCGGGADTQATASQAPPDAPPPTPPPPTPPPAAGLDQRPANASCHAWARPAASSSISLERFTNLTFSSPIGLLQAPNDASRWFVVEQGGVVRQFSASNPSSARDFIDISGRVVDGGEMGLLGMAFHPGFPTDPRVFLSYTTVVSGQRVSRISAFRTTNGGDTANPDPEEVLLVVNQPQSNHNGGHIAFGPDGYLYIGLGDGGGGGDPDGNGQRMTTMLGKMLRIDVDSGTPYGIPSTNPFAQNALCPAGGRAAGECPEIFASGFRNPWRWSFDRDTGQLWVADVGQNAWEEVNQVVLGGNYGWRCREGAHNFNTSGCPSSGLIDPIAEYDHALGASITGGYVYRGSQTTALSGRYLFADFVSGRIWAWIPENATQPRVPTQLLDTDLNISTFGEGNDGELYVAHHGGTLHRIVFQAPGGGGSAPATLSATGCVSANDPKQPASGLIPYDINAPFWSDGASKERWIALPDDQRITVQSGGDWELPAGAVVMKHFRIDSQLIETRLFMRHPDGAWGGFSYEWNAQQTDATLVQGGAVRDIGNGQQWIFPSESQCLECHTSAAGRTLGLETAQLNRTFTYAQTGRTAHQLVTLNSIGVLAPPLTDPTAQASIPSPDDTSVSLEARARAYLHTNCAQCHRPGGPTPSNMDLRYTTTLAATNTCDVMPQSGDLGLGVAARLIAPGNPANSLIVNRMQRRDLHAMPPLGSASADSAGVALLSDWIAALTCP
jgi:uncharacterized repeat protein (TIGR03806 family)